MALTRNIAVSSVDFKCVTTIYNKLRSIIAAGLNNSFIPLATRRRRRQQQQATIVIKMEETVTANTAASAVAMTEASEKLVATTTVHFRPLTSSENVLALQNLAIFANTSKNTSWATNAWIEWTKYVLQQGVDPEDAPSALIK